MGTFAQWALPHLIANHCGIPVPITRDAAIPCPLFNIGRGTRVLPLRSIPQELLVRRSPGYLPAVVRLNAVLDPGASASHSSLSRSPHGLRPNGVDRHRPNIPGSRSYVSDSGLHPSLRHTRLSSLPARAFSHYTTERMTNPYSGGPVRISAPSLSAGNHCQVTPLFQYSSRVLSACAMK